MVDVINPRDEVLDIETPEIDELPIALENEATGESYELIEGVLVPRSRTDNEHGIVCGRSILILGMYSIQSRQLARIGDSSTAFYTRGDTRTVRKPDVAFTFAARIPAAPSVEDYLHIPPNLVIEVVSPGNKADEIEQKTQEWFAFGVRLVWLMFPESKRIHVYPDMNHAYILRGEDKITGGDALPGFESPIAAFFYDRHD